MLRYRADLRTLLYLFFSSFLMIFLFFQKEILSSSWLSSLWIIQLMMSISVGVIVHNHKHVAIWKGKFLNTITDCWLTLLYGFPVFGWIPTHLQNHHLHTNKEEDYTKTYAYSERNNLWTILIYPMYSGGIQQKAIFEYMKSLYRKDKNRFWIHCLQIAVLIIFTTTVFIIDWQKAILYVILPQQVALNSVLVFNYLQHIHADEESEYNHSRNIDGWMINAFLFNNGLHTAHHEKPNLHWSRVPAYHKEIKHLIDPSLNEKSFLWFLIKQYILSPFNRNFGTISLREKRLAKQAEAT